MPPERERENPTDLKGEIGRILETTTDRYPMTSGEVIKFGEHLKSVAEALRMIERAKAMYPDPGKRPTWLIELFRVLEGINSKDWNAVTGAISNYEQAIRQIKQLLNKE